MHGQLVVGSLINIDGTFTFKFAPNPFLIRVTANATISLAGIGGLAFNGGFQIDQYGLSLYANMQIGNGPSCGVTTGSSSDFGGSLGLSIGACATLAFSTSSRSVDVRRPDRPDQRRALHRQPGLPAHDPGRDRLRRDRHGVRRHDDRDQPERLHDPVQPRHLARRRSSRSTRAASPASTTTAPTTPASSCSSTSASTSTSSTSSRSRATARSG